MSNVINLPTYEQSREIKENTVNILSKLGMKSYVPFSKSVSVPTAAISTPTIYHTVTGKGFLNKAVVEYLTATHTFRVILDGIEYKFTKGNRSASGLLVEDLIIRSTSTPQTLINGVTSTVSDLANFNSNAINAGALILGDVLYFNESLVIKHDNAGVAYGGTRFQVEGGLYID